MSAEPAPEAVAIVGMAGRFPGASTPEAFFDMLCRGVESVRAERDWPRGVDAAPRARPEFAGRAAGVLEGIDQLDAAYFGLTPREAEVMDPQQRLFLECCAEALQRAGHDEGGGQRVGVYAGMGVNTYFLDHVYPNARVMDGAGAFQAVSSNEKDFIATQVAYRLNLTGPAMTVQTACSTSLVAVVLASEALLSHQCDAALAGGAAVKIDPAYGSFLEEGGIAAKDGRCRAFDAKASGTVSGSGVGVVLLKRLSDALRDGDHVHAVIRGAALNNDGARKMGFAAPSVEGQASVVAEAHALAGVEPDEVGFVEAHGTGTQVGDPIEVAALTKVFRARTDRRGFCALGSVKGNVGHADAAAGVVGLIKAALAVERATIPPTLHFETPNPALRLDESPFHVNRETIPWPEGRARVAGVSSFGIGGTNAHVVLAQAPARAPPAPDARPQVLLLSARTPGALDAAAKRLREHLEERPDAPLADLAWTLQVGRRRFAHRLALPCRDREDALHALREAPRRLLTRAGEAADAPVAFLFPGQGAQRVGMARGLYETEPAFRADVDACCEILRPHLDADLREVLFPAPERRAEAETRLATTLYTQPALFVVEYALARLWMRWGVQPRAFVGHSLGEYVAATLAGVMALPDALALVAIRARLLQETAEGAMLAVPMDEERLRALLPPTLSLAAVNAPESCVVSGAPAAVEAFERALAAQGVEARRLRVQRAFHSALMGPVLARFEEAVARVPLQAPRIPIASNLTGRWLEAREATDPRYWARHLRETVRFSECVQRLLEDPSLVLLEVGPGRTLSSLATRHLARPNERVVATSLPGAQEEGAADDALAMREALGRLWLGGARVDWRAVHAPARRRRVHAPTYAFERRRHWLPPARAASSDAPAPEGVRLVGWRRADAPDAAARAEPQRVLLVGGDDALADEVARRLRREGHEVALARPAAAFADETPLRFALPLDDPAAPAVLATRLDAAGWRPTRLLRIPAPDEPPALAASSLVRLLQAFPAPPRPVVATRRAFDVTGDEAPDAAQAALAGALLALPETAARVVDLADATTAALAADAIARALADGAPRVVALRGRHAWIRAHAAGPARAPDLAGQACVVLDPGSPAGAALAGALRRAGADVRAPGAPGARLVARAVPPFEAVPLAKLDAAALARALDAELAALAALRAAHPDARVVALADAASPLAGASAGAAEAAAAQGAPWLHLACEDWTRADPDHLLAALAAPPGAGAIVLVAREAASPDAPGAAAERPALGATYVAPRTPLEEALVRAWEDLFGIEGIGVEDDFFDLGGHSLLATRIVARVRDDFGVEVALSRFFEARTVSDFALALEEVLLERLEGMSEEEARRALGGE